MITLPPPPQSEGPGSECSRRARGELERSGGFVLATVRGSRHDDRRREARGSIARTKFEPGPGLRSGVHRERGKSAARRRWVVRRRKNASMRTGTCTHGSASPSTESLPPGSARDSARGSGCGALSRRHGTRHARTDAPAVRRCAAVGRDADSRSSSLGRETGVADQVQTTGDQLYNGVLGKGSSHESNE